MGAPRVVSEPRGPHSHIESTLEVAAGVIVPSAPYSGCCAGLYVGSILSVAIEVVASVAT